MPALMQIKHQNLDDVETIKFQIIQRVAYFALAIHVALIFIFYHLGASMLALANIFSVFAWASGINLINKGRHSLALKVFSIEVLLHSILVCATLGLELGFQFYLWTISCLLLVDYQLKLKHAFIYSLMLIFTFAALYLFFSDVVYSYAYKDFLLYINMLNIVIAGLPMVYAIGLIREISISQRIALTDMAAKDHLTKLYNRRFAKKLILAAQQKSVFTNTNLCLVMADIDFFKHFNDTYGHDKGDAILVRVANVINQHIAEQDIAVRWGGEEFLIVLTNTNEQNAFTRIERMRDNIAALNCAEQGGNLNITMSFGLIQWQSNASLEEMLQQADAALYKSKENGRNQTTIATTETDYTAELKSI
ncbi:MULTISPECIES: GGDEF domain-containing protein [Pseudoalteromonas]|uniref:diguanylate cyclase n=1 Tax=Pseudoalteromonas haloplanktis TaxID=228 RepID=A0ABU1BCU5_PSEHA|nr:MULTISPECIES: GGDEF domain-containing protein [Pseudoalteromonas]MCF6144525.1 hypothetical protein [Pseudoalteromonas mariniglutinosa NCIMB 1770]MDQ9092216.1 GGDEF domain-containing protein [Pseudoalteromonas haloplanktis]TMN71821.1 GGDEF domain-containing protein [Pseudoalteromonas sp. S1727]BDF96159.1 GGDEF domain-containing protein [Pseudoalteromonas sp. KAN5]